MEEKQALAKQALRRTLRKKRRSLDPALAAGWDERLEARLLALPRFMEAAAIFIYVSMPGEPGTHGIIQAALAAGKRVYVPRCGPDYTMETVPIRSMEDLAQGYYGIYEPLPQLEGEVRSFDLMILPALACGLDKTRLGQGGGYYDRFLAANPSPSLVLCYEDFLLDTVPVDAYDMPMQGIVTEDRVL